jgi:hypothetical protein
LIGIIFGVNGASGLGRGLNSDTDNVCSKEVSEADEDDRRSHRLGWELIERFKITPKRCIEFGVQHGFSTAALANYFKHVIGVDTFAGDEMAGIGDPDHTFHGTKEALKNFSNITLARTSYQDWIRKDDSEYDLVHVDIVHTYEDTYRCGDWAAEMSDVVIFHDTLAFPDVRYACMALAEDWEMYFYNYPNSYGLGILSRRKIQ